MRYLIIGLGIYGSNLAKDLTDMGHEVIGADRSPTIVDSIKEYISTAYILDSTDEAALSGLPLTGVDLVIVAIGENFGASIKTVAILKKLGVKHIYARAADDLHYAILEGLQIDRIITPEQRAARDLSMEMALGHQARVMNVAPEIYTMRFEAPDLFVGSAYSRLRMDKEHGLQLIAAFRPADKKNLLGVSSKNLDPIDLTQAEVTPGDILLCYGPRHSFLKLMAHCS
ncbi:MAG: TrkA family potassium uptake protein [Muribaculaceae bacterium]|nr:TrkA family potassium uptake protein [Muribaculaceae bacterium]